MSTRSYIAKQISKNQYKTIYCHSDGYLTHNGAMLFDHYSDADKLDELLNLGDISYLAPNINPDPSMPHSFKYDERQDGVIVAYGRDRGDKDVEAKMFSQRQLTSTDTWCAYIYVFNKDNQWVYGRPGQDVSEFRNVKEELDITYSHYDMERPEGYYGYLSEEVADLLKERQSDAQTESQEQTM